MVGNARGPAQAQGAQRLLRAWAQLAATALGLSALAAVVLVLARTPGLTTPGLASLFAPALVMHVNLATLVWFLAFSVVLFCCLGALPPGTWGWVALAVSALGLATVSLSPLLAPGPVVLSNYFPLVNSSWFIAGLLIFFAGIGLALARVAWQLPRKLPGPASPLRGPMAWSLVVFASVAVSLGLTIRSLPSIEPALVHEVANWAPGHLMQYFYIASMMLAWVWMAAALGWERSHGRRLAWPFALLALPCVLALGIHGLFQSTAPEFRKAFTVMMALTTWPGPLLLIWRWRHDLCQWRGNLAPVAAAFRGSVLLFIVGCVVGAFIRGDNTMVPAHYHGTVGAATLAFIGVATRLLQLDVSGRRAVAWVWLYGVGLSLMVAALTWSGRMGAPRKSAYVAAAAGKADFAAAMALHGVGGLLAVTGTAMLAAAMLVAARKGVVLTGLDLSTPTPRHAVRKDVRQRGLALTLAAVLVLGGLLAMDGRQDEARAAVTRALAWWPTVDRYSHVVERERTEVDLRFGQGVTMLHAKQFDFAVTAFHRVLKLRPNMPEAHANMGFALLGLSKFDAARDFFEGATALNPMQGNAYYGLALALEARGDLEGAIGAMRTYLHLAKNQSEPHLRNARSALWEWEAQVKALREDQTKGGRAPAAGTASAPTR
ncbi:MAG: cbb3-type cytochrome c oxidase subunit I [Burkholderiaceae bacterium]|nr:cbb3-type cytochrome c oxidase subunit I [Burkholderiaceae bacterium]